MRLLVLDAETFFDDEFTLKKLTTEAYIRDARFELLMFGVLDTATGDKFWLPRDEFIEWAKRVDWANTGVVFHHAHFDALILSHHFNIRPGMIYDTLPMARMLHGNHASASLASLSSIYGVEGKSVPYDAFRGRRWNSIPDPLRRQLGAGCLHDIEITWHVFQQMAKTFPKQEYRIIDMNTRAFTEPKLIGDVDALAEVWTNEAIRKTAQQKQLADDLGVDPAALPKLLGSNETFTVLLAAEDIEVPMKAGKNGEIPCFAKTDDFMQELLEHDDERVAALAEVRLGLKSNIEQTRSERLGWMATRGLMCVYLANYAAHTTRYGGGDKVNWQNLKRGSGIRKAIKAPAGHKAVKADKAQIELRLLSYVAEQWDVIERLKTGADPYIDIASKFYGRSITKANPAERGVGKQLELSCGYGAGAATIARTAKRGTYGPPVLLSPEQAVAARDLYRSTHVGVVNYWKTANRMISALAGTNEPVAWGPMTVDTGVIWLPGGTPIWYPELHYHRNDEGDEFWRYKTRKGWAKLYGGKLTENVIQALSAVDMRESILRIWQRTGIGYSTQEHDAAVWLCPDALVEPFVKVVTEEMTRAPTWLPGIPLGADVDVKETL